MLLDKLTRFLDRTHGFRYVRDEYRMEIWRSEREELPVVVSSIGGRHIIAWSDLVYEGKDVERVYGYLVRILTAMDEFSS